MKHSWSLKFHYGIKSEKYDLSSNAKIIWIFIQVWISSCTCKLVIKMKNEIHIQYHVRTVYSTGCLRKKKRLCSRLSIFFRTVTNNNYTFRSFSHDKNNLYLVVCEVSTPYRILNITKFMNMRGMMGQTGLGWLNNKC